MISDPPEVNVPTPDTLRPFTALAVIVLMVLGQCETAEATNGLKLTAYGPRAAGRA